MTLVARILGVSVWGPGLEGWAVSRAVLAGETPYEARPSPPPAPTLLAATERRRTGPVVRLALAVAQEAVAASCLEPGGLRAVFGSSNGDGPVVGSILEALATARGDERIVSPTQFHNSVHNAAAGYWSIGTGSQQPATCIGCHDDTWAASLLAAMAEVATAGQPVLLCCYDHDLPPPLDALRPIGGSFGVALVLGASGTGPTLALDYAADATPPADLPLDPALQRLARSNPAARALPLLAALARGGPHRHDLPYLQGRLSLEVRP
ncbi:MAG: hypothetical protein NVSMB18_00480 [Acetobacteraceae bacterium]